MAKRPELGREPWALPPGPFSPLHQDTGLGLPFSIRRHLGVSGP